MKTFLFTILVTMLAGCSISDTSVEIRLKSKQVEANFHQMATYALALPQGTDTKIYLFPTPGKICAEIQDESSIGEIYLPRGTGALWGLKFAPPGRPTWAAAVPGGAAAFSRLSFEEGRISGCVDSLIDESDGGNSGMMKGCFVARTCPPMPVSALASKPGSSEVTVSMKTPVRSWTSEIGTAIAFVAYDRLMIFFQDGPGLNCENYRLLQKQGLIEFLREPGMTRFSSSDLVKASPVDPESGWSFHYGRSLMEIVGATAELSEDGRSVTGSIDVSFKGIDPLTASSQHGKGNPDQFKGFIKGRFAAPVCPEF